MRRLTFNALRINQHLALVLSYMFTALSASVLFVIGFGNLQKLLVPLGTQDIALSYLFSALWAQGTPLGSTWLGYPDGIDLRYFPSTDIVQNAFAGLIVGVSGNDYLGINAVFALSFPAAAVSALWVLRLVGARGPLAWVLAMAVTFIPFHWGRIEHVYLATMYPAILGVGMVFLIGGGKLNSLFSNELRLRGRVISAACLAVLLVLIGWGGFYYAVFTIILSCFALLWRILTQKELLSNLIPGLVVIAVISAILLIPMLPTLLLPYFGGDSSGVAHRLPVESVIFAGALALLMLPLPHTGIPILSKIYSIIEMASGRTGELATSGISWFTNYGTLVTTALWVFLLIALAVILRRRSLAAPGQEEQSQVQAISGPFVAYVAGVSLLLFVPWGINYLFAAFVNPSVRAWERMLPVLVILLAAGAALAWRNLCLRWDSRVSYGAALVLTVLIIVDSVLPWRQFINSQVEAAHDISSSGVDYANELNATVPENCGVLQMPFVRFPEEVPPGEMGSYDHLWPALTNQDKLWSYGAMRNTSAETFSMSLPPVLDSQSIALLRSEGFCLIHLDLQGYGEAEGEQMVSSLTSQLGQPVSSVFDGRWLAFRL